MTFKPAYLVSHIDHQREQKPPHNKPNKRQTISCEWSILLYIKHTMSPIMKAMTQTTYWCEKTPANNHRSSWISCHILCNACHHNWYVFMWVLTYVTHHRVSLVKCVDMCFSCFNTLLYYYWWYLLMCDLILTTHFLISIADICPLQMKLIFVSTLMVHSYFVEICIKF